MLLPPDMVRGTATDWVWATYITYLLIGASAGLLRARPHGPFRHGPEAEAVPLALVTNGLRVAKVHRKSGQEFRNKLSKSFGIGTVPQMKALQRDGSNDQLA